MIGKKFDQNSMPKCRQKFRFGEMEARKIQKEGYLAIIIKMNQSK
jgi:hypothetical protein